MATSEVHVLTFFQEFWAFLRVRKRYWVIPLILMAVMFGSFILLTQGTVIAPFIYAIF